MKLIRPVDLKARALKLWDTQRLQRAWVTGEALFPLEIPLGTPSGAELVECFGEVRSWIQELKAESKEAKGYGYSLVEKAIMHRQLGLQRLPATAVIETQEDAARLAGKWQAFGRLQTMTMETRRRQPALESFLAQKPLIMLEHDAVWSRLLDICDHVKRRPRPGCYPRELDVPGVDTKFIERYQALLWELLPLVLEPGMHDASISRREQHGFERRFGLRYDPPLIRYRVLDPTISAGGFTDLSVPLAEFARWPAGGVERVFVTENKVNGLAFPAVPGSIVVFGLGYGIQALGEVPWLAGRVIRYWGDMDTHGFAMLARLRGRWPHTASLLMDEGTLLEHRALWGQEAEGQRYREDLPLLTPQESAVYDGLRRDFWGDRVRLEQERLPFRALELALAHIDTSI